VDEESSEEAALCGRLLSEYIGGRAGSILESGRVRAGARLAAYLGKAER
jgi:hypothetical protein